MAELIQVMALQPTTAKRRALDDSIVETMVIVWYFLCSDEELCVVVVYDQMMVVLRLLEELCCCCANEMLLAVMLPFQHPRDALYLFYCFSIVGKGGGPNVLPHQARCSMTLVHTTRSFY